MRAPHEHLLKLRDVAEINPRLKSALPNETVVSFLPMSEVYAECGTTGSGETRMYGDVCKGYTPFLNGDLLVAKITPCFENGKIAQANLSHKLGFGSTEFHVVRPQHDKVNARYLLHFLRRPEIRSAGENRMTGSAGQRRVPQAFLTDLSIPLPPLAEQRRIADILDRADVLRVKRRAALAKLDTLTQAIFLDMFGNPATNPKGWNVGVIKDLLDSASYGTSEKASTVGEFPVLRMNNITNTGHMNLRDLKYMNLPDAVKLRYLVSKGDVLFNRTNSPELVGKTAIYREDTPMAYAGYLIRLRVNEVNDPEFLSSYLNTKYAKHVLRGMSKSIIGMANINATEIQAMKVFQPPLKIQQEFSRRVETIEDCKKLFHAQLMHFDTLFTSLQYRAFRGNL